MTRRFVIDADGGARGDPGIAAGGAVVVDAETGKTVAELGVYMGIAAEDVAHYSGVIGGLEAAFARDPSATVRVRSRSRTLSDQLSGRSRVTHPNTQVLARRARELVSGRDVSFDYTPRGEGEPARAAADESMDRRESFRRDFDGVTA